MGNSIGSLYIDIIARTQSLEQDMARVKNQVNGLGSGLKDAGGAAQTMGQQIGNAMGTNAIERFTSRFILYRLFHEVVNEIKYVIDNIEKIPGIPPEAVVSVQEFRLNLRDARQVIDSFIAEGITGFVNFGKAVGAGAASMVGYEDGLTDAMKAQLPTLEELKELNDPNYHQKVLDAIKRLSDARKADTVASMKNAEAIAELRKQAQQYETFASSKSQDALTRVNAQIKAYELLKQADGKQKDMLEQLDAAHQRVIKSLGREQVATLGWSDQLEGLKNRIGILQFDLSQLNIADPNNKDPALLQKKIELTKQLADAQEKYATALHHVVTSEMVWRDVFVKGTEQMADALTSFITGGDIKLSQFLKSMADQIISTFLKLAILNPILNAIFGGSQGFSMLPTLFSAGAKASGGPAGGLTLVGEQGPELVNLPSGSTVIPATKTAQMLSQGSGGGNVYQIDARGADVGAVERIERSLYQLAGPGVVEKRALAVTANTRWRGGAAASALGANT